MGPMLRKTVGRRGRDDKDDALSGKEKKQEQQAYGVFAGVELEAWSKGRATGQSEQSQCWTLSAVQLLFCSHTGLVARGHPDA